ALHDLLLDLTVSRDDSRASQQLVVFQLAEALDQAITSVVPPEQPSNRDDALDDFRGTIMWLTYDDRGNAEQLIREALLDDVRKSDPPKKYRDIEELIKEALWRSNNEKIRQIPDRIVLPGKAPAPSDSLLELLSEVLNPAFQK